MGKALFTQLHIMFLRKDYLVALSLVLGLNLYSYLAVVLGHFGEGLAGVYSWHYLYAGNTSSNVWSIFSVLYPFIVALPFGFSYFQDRKTGLLAQYVRRTGVRHYYDAKLWAAFCGSFLVIAVPFGVNLLMSYFTFPHNYYSPIPYEQLLTGANVERTTVFATKPFADLFVSNLFLYNLLFLAFLSLLSGLLGMFATAFSFWVKRMRILVFVPLFAVFQLLRYVDGVILGADGLSYFNTNILDYVGTDAFYGQSLVFIGAFTGVVAAFILFSRWCAVRREDIL